MACLQKPITLGVPALISNLMTHEFCLSVCQELQTKFAIVKNDKCFCLNDGRGNTLNITIDFEKYRRSTCGKPCPGTFFSFIQYRACSSRLSGISEY